MRTSDCLIGQKRNISVAQAPDLLFILLCKLCMRFAGRFGVGGVGPAALDLLTVEKVVKIHLLSEIALAVSWVRWGERFMSSELFWLLAVILAGKRIAAIQEAGLIGITPVGWVPQVDVLGCIRACRSWRRSSSVFLRSWRASGSVVRGPRNPDSTRSAGMEKDAQDRPAAARKRLAARTHIGGTVGGIFRTLGVSGEKNP